MTEAPVRCSTVIVGGGIAGLACGQALAGAAHDFRLLTDRLGGRLHMSDDGEPLGAAYITSDYHHVLPYTDHGGRFWKKDVYFWDGERHITLLSLSNLQRVRQLGKLCLLLARFRSRLNALRARAPFECQRELMEADPVLQRAVQQSAPDFVREHGLQEVNEIFCAPVFYSTLFVPWHESNAFYWLATMFPVLLSTYPLDLRRTAERMAEGWRDRIVFEKATAVQEHEGGGFTVTAGAKQYRCDDLVLAVPGRNAAGLLQVEQYARDVGCATLHVRGKRREAFVPGKVVFLRQEHPARVLWARPSGVDIVYADRVDPDLSAYYDGYEVVDAVQWKTAVQLSGDRWRSLAPRPHLYAIGDHNVVGLEDSFLTGLFAANRILGRSVRKR